MKFPRSKFVAAGSLTAVAALAVVGGTLATFTDSTTADAQVLTTGTVEVNAVEGNNWNADITNLGIGDSASRDVTLDNNSSLPIGSMRLTADVQDTPGPLGGHLSDAVTVDILQGSTVLADGVRLSALADGYDLVFDGDLAPNTDVPLTFVYEVPGAPVAETGDRTVGARESASNPDNKYQGSSLSATYTIDAVQRAGVSH